MACDTSRFDATIGKRIPLVLSVGALDMVNFGAKDTIPSNFQHRKIHEHNKQVITDKSLTRYNTRRLRTCLEVFRSYIES